MDRWIGDTRFPFLAGVRPCRLSERGDRLLVLVVHLEERQEAAHAQSLCDNLRKTGQLHLSSRSLAGLKNFDEETDAAGIKPVDAGQIEDDLCFAVGDQIVEGLPQRFDRRSQNQTSLYRDQPNPAKFQITGFELRQLGSLRVCPMKMSSGTNA